MSSVILPMSANCDCDVEEIAKILPTVVVAPTPREPMKYELALVVEIRDPTVRIDDVAMSAEPFEFDTMMEFAGKRVDPVPPFTTGSVPVI